VRELLRDRRALQQGAAGLVAQLTQAAAGLGIILVIREAGGSLSLAGAAAAFAAAAISATLATILAVVVRRRLATGTS
jgi:hypothetical protein